MKFKLAKDLVSGDVFEYNGKIEVATDGGAYMGCMWTTNEEYYIDWDNNPKGLCYGYTSASIIEIDDNELVKVIRNMRS